MAAAMIIAMAVNTFMATAFDFKFWGESLAQVAVYRWATPAAMTDKGGTTSAVGAADFAGRLRGAMAHAETGRLAITQRTGFLVGGYVFGLAVMQSALVRSDIGHVIIGESAMIFLVERDPILVRGTGLLHWGIRCPGWVHAVFASGFPTLQCSPALRGAAKPGDGMPGGLQRNLIAPATLIHAHRKC